MAHTVFQMPSRVINGLGCFETLSEEVKRLGASRVLLVMDPFLIQNGFAGKTAEKLQEQGLGAAVFDKVEPEPRLEIPEEAAKLAGSFKADIVVAVGGGSSMDIAKVLSILVTNEEKVRDLVGVGLVKKPGLPKIFIPTTAGSGSEVSMVAVFSDTVAKTKVSVWSPHLLANTVLLDAELTVGLPRAGTAATGMDALIHAVESYTSRIATPATDLYAEKAIRLISKYLRPAWARGDNLEARENMMTAAFYSGLALSNASTAGVHALSSPLGSEFHVPHGVANSIMLLPVLRRSLTGHLGRYARIAAFMGEDVEGLTDREAADLCVAALDRLIEDLRVPRHMADYGVTKDDVPVLAKSVMQLTRLLSYNPYTITYEDAVAMYTDAL